MCVSNICEEHAKNELERLAKLIYYYDRLYYLKDASPISDYEYDALRIRNKEIEMRFPDLVRFDSPSKRIGVEGSERFDKVEHRVPMLSIENALSDKEVYEFIKRIKRFLRLSKESFLEFTVEPKIDGLSLALRYERGELIYASTRGDGRFGEDLTANARVIPDIPCVLRGICPKVLEVRGEVYMNHKDFLDLNKEQKKIGCMIFSNPRNAASGSLRQFDVSVTAARRLKFFAYGWGVVSDIPSDTQLGMVKCLSHYGFRVNPLTELCHNAESMIRSYRFFEKNRFALSYEIDGVVYKVNSLFLQKRLSCLSRSPRWAIAYKFLPEKAMTVLRAIDIHVGRTGVLTPVALFDPVIVRGVVMKKATLHNDYYISGDRRDLRLGDTVIVQRAGDVIPQIVDILLEKRLNTSIPYMFPSSCPSCHSPIVRYGQGYRCIKGLLCPAQALERLHHFVNAFNIKGLGIERIKKFFYSVSSSIAIKSPVDIFTLENRQKCSLDLNKLENMKGFGKQSLRKIYNAINARRVVVLSHFLFSLGIPHVGELVALRLARYYISYALFENSVKESLRNKDKTLNKAFKELLSIEGIGLVIAEAILNFYNDEYNSIFLERLLKEITILDEECFSIGNSPFLGKTIVFTGCLKAMSRAEAKTRIKNLGAKAANSISFKTDLLVIGSAPGLKLKKAADLGIQMMNEEEWMAIISSYDHVH
ncbi:MAG: DNA ligase (NAD+) [Candidatus Tokpelaia sp. JSC161]|nr:MAG: DNA ligase (NAD+) [Candidatus Tokpelaia sp. JSC161]